VVDYFYRYAVKEDGLECLSTEAVREQGGLGLAVHIWWCQEERGDRSL
jgi:hypothetical protein